ncbi:hypothetical protein FA13DRAFT_1735123, partial [Coprinellus micaceus]
MRHVTSQSKRPQFFRHWHQIHHPISRRTQSLYEEQLWHLDLPRDMFRPLYKSPGFSLIQSNLLSAEGCQCLANRLGIASLNSRQT